MGDGTKPGEGQSDTPDGSSGGDGGVKQPSLREFVHSRVTELFTRLSEEDCKGVYRLVILEVEGSLLEAVMQRTAGNQGRAARILGINRGTLRKKLDAHGLIPWSAQPAGGGDG